MSQITARLPDELVEALDRAAVEHYLAEFEDLAIAVARLRDPSDPVLDWDQIRGDLLPEDQA